MTHRMDILASLAMDAGLEVRRIGPHVLALGDCAPILPMLAGQVDAVISDPPYGQRYRIDSGSRRTGSLHAGRWVPRDKYGTGLIAGDDRPFDPARMLSLAPRVALWGAHKFHHRLPLGTWLVWDKVPTGKVRDQGDGEAAWINDDPPRPLRIVRYLWDGVCVAGSARADPSKGRFERLHPTEKPLHIMEFTLFHLRVQAGSIIIDPYMGSGTTGVAVARSGNFFFGIEIDRNYFMSAVSRLERIHAMPDLFGGQP